MVPSRPCAQVRVLDAIRVAITAIERSEVMDVLDKVSGASRREAFLQWIENDVDECVCGGRMIKNERVVLTSIPPKYIWTCASCGKVEERV